MPFPLAIPLLIQLAGSVPALMKFVGAGTKSVEIAEQVVSVARAVTGETDNKKAADIIANDPAKAAEFQIRVNEQMMAWDSMFLLDIQDAREREVKLRQAGYTSSRANMMLISAYIGVAICFLGIWSSDINEFQKSVLSLVLGRMLGYIDQGFNFEFGTTRTSRSKDDVIEKLTKNGHS